MIVLFNIFPLYFHLKLYRLFLDDTVCLNTLFRRLLVLNESFSSVFPADTPKK